MSIFLHLSSVFPFVPSNQVFYFPGGYNVYSYHSPDQAIYKKLSVSEETVFHFFGGTVFSLWMPTVINTLLFPGLLN